MLDLSTSFKNHLFSEPETNGTFGQSGPLIRPLPWVLFLPLLILLRIVRACVNAAAMLVGGEGIKPTTIVRWAQTRRRRVRAIKFRGLRRMLHRPPRHNMADDTTSTWRNRLFDTIKQAVCIGYKHNDTSVEMVHTENTTEVPVSII